VCGPCESWSHMMCTCLLESRLDVMECSCAWQRSGVIQESVMCAASACGRSSTDKCSLRQAARYSPPRFPSWRSYHPSALSLSLSLCTLPRFILSWPSYPDSSTLARAHPVCIPLDAHSLSPARSITHAFLGNLRVSICTRMVASAFRR